MMNGFGMGGGGGLVVLLVGVALIGLVVFAVVRLAGDGSSASEDEDESLVESTPREVLDQRLARGEIDAESYSAIVERLAHGAGR